jgi:hypothetical protein
MKGRGEAARETREQHYWRVMNVCKAAGFHEPMSLAESGCRRADTLYDLHRELVDSKECVEHLGLLPDGRMAMYGPTLGVFEMKPSTQLVIVISEEDAKQFNGNPSVEQRLLQSYITVASRYNDRRVVIQLPNGQVQYIVNSHIPAVAQ